MNKLSLIIFTLFFSLNLFSQQPHWEWVKHAGSGSDDIGFAVYSNGNVIYNIGGYNGVGIFDNLNVPNSGFSSGAYIAKLDKQGNYKWVKSINGTDSRALSAIVSDNDQIYVTGYFFETIYIDTNILTATSQFHPDAFFTSLDSNGIFQWAKGAGYNGMDAGMTISVINKNIIVGGHFDTLIAFDTLHLSSTNGEIFALNITSNGTYQWANNYGGSVDDFTWDMTTSADKYVYMASGIHNSIINGNDTITSHGWNDAFLLKIDTLGNLQWAINAGGTGADWGQSVACDSTGNVYLLGDYSGLAYVGNTIVSCATSTRDMFIAKYSASGNFIWVKNIDISNAYPGNMSNKLMVADKYSNIYVTGFFKDTLRFEGIELISDGSFDVFVIKLDSSGHAIWGTSAGGLDGDYAYSIAIDNNNDLYITGRFYETAWFGSQSVTSYASGSCDIFIAKLSQTPVSVENSNIEKQEFTLFPNPNNGRMKIEYNIQGQGKLDIFDITGKKIYSIEIKEGKNTVMINSNNFSNGIYYYQVTAGNSFVKTEKLIISK